MSFHCSLVAQFTPDVVAKVTSASRSQMQDKVLIGLNGKVNWCLRRPKDLHISGVFFAVRTMSETVT
jgi:hypothetical protein